MIIGQLNFITFADFFKLSLETSELNSTNSGNGILTRKKISSDEISYGLLNERDTSGTSTSITTDCLVFLSIKFQLYQALFEQQS
ncbi:hypothetical protein BpHYR1_054571 [Brachionus plicatilis]|uniref:Uncharacterized protein n=1 Tax=Brachionus plicatilis TaxID=10195 RepID=A0A3M7R7A4_BRAPC|nr:hypothetical protein BpHYR1_054571 [Brachionus plicatilis]